MSSAFGCGADRTHIACCFPWRTAVASKALSATDRNTPSTPLWRADVANEIAQRSWPQVQERTRHRLCLFALSGAKAPSELVSVAAVALLAVCFLPLVAVALAFIMAVPVSLALVMAMAITAVARVRVAAVLFTLMAIVPVSLALVV